MLAPPTHAAALLSRLPYPIPHLLPQIRYDALLEQFGADLHVYSKMVCDTIVTTVPKAIVHCLVGGDAFPSACWG